MLASYLPYRWVLIKSTKLTNCVSSGYSTQIFISPDKDKFFYLIFFSHNGYYLSLSRNKDDNIDFFYGLWLFIAFYGFQKWKMGGFPQGNRTFILLIYKNIFLVILKWRFVCDCLSLLKSVFQVGWKPSKWNLDHITLNTFIQTHANELLLSSS